MATRGGAPAARRRRRRGSRASRRRAHRWPGERPPAPRSRSPRFQATSAPPGASSGKASSTRSAVDATARAVTAGHVRPASGRRPGPRLARSDRHAVGQAGRLDHGAQEPRLLADRLGERDRRAGEGRGEGQARVAAAGAEVEDPVRGPLPQPGEGRQAVEDVRRRDRGRVADRGEVDVARPGQQQPDVPIDRRPGRGVATQLLSPRRRVRGRGRRVRGRQGRDVLDARRERLALGVHGTPPLVPRATVRAAPLPASTLLAPWALVRSSAIHPVHGRVSPSPSRTALPSRSPQCGKGTYGPSAGPVNRVYPRTPPRGSGFVDKST